MSGQIGSATYSARQSFWLYAIFPAATMLICFWVGYGIGRFFDWFFPGVYAAEFSWSRALALLSGVLCVAMVWEEVPDRRWISVGTVGVLTVLFLVGKAWAWNATTATFAETLNKDVNWDVPGQYENLGIQDKIRRMDAIRDFRTSQTSGRILVVDLDLHGVHRVHSLLPSRIRAARPSALSLVAILEDRSRSTGRIAVNFRTGSSKEITDKSVELSLYDPVSKQFLLERKLFSYGRTPWSAYVNIREYLKNVDDKLDAETLKIKREWESHSDLSESDLIHLREATIQQIKILEEKSKHQEQSDSEVTTRNQKRLKLLKVRLHEITERM